VVLLGAFLFTRTCGSHDIRVSDDQAIAIAKQEIDYTPDRVQVRLVRRGVQSRPYWAVSLSTVGPNDRPERITVVLVDARTKEVTEVRTSRG
jgi:Peptidase propeptide and YPEB domain